MMITNLSLIAIFICAFFIVICSIWNKIQIYPSTKAILCLSMLGIIGVISGELHPYQGMAFDLTLGMLSLLVIRQTVVAYRRGFM